MNGAPYLRGIDNDATAELWSSSEECVSQLRALVAYLLEKNERLRSVIVAQSELVTKDSGPRYLSDRLQTLSGAVELPQ